MAILRTNYSYFTLLAMLVNCTFNTDLFGSTCINGSTITGQPINFTAPNKSVAIDFAKRKEQEVAHEIATGLIANYQAAKNNGYYFNSPEKQMALVDINKVYKNVFNRVHNSTDFKSLLKHSILPRLKVLLPKPDSKLYNSQLNKLTALENWINS